jgi:hypothetical protein
MRKILGIAKCFAVFVFAAAVFAGTFKIYPGANPDEQAAKEIRHSEAGMGSPQILSAVYTTNDSFEKVKAFYSEIAEEYTIPGIGGNQAFFIFDGAEDIVSSKLWIKIQRPLAAGMKPQEFDVETLKKMKSGGTIQVQTQGLRDITGILLYEED